MYASDNNCEHDTLEVVVIGMVEFEATYGHASRKEYLNILREYCYDCNRVVEYAPIIVDDQYVYEEKVLNEGKKLMKTKRG